VRFTPDDPSTGELAWHDDAPWRLQLKVAESASGYAVSAALERHGAEMPLSEPRSFAEDALSVCACGGTRVGGCPNCGAPCTATTIVGECNPYEYFATHEFVRNDV
jgi:hypothetical protein